MGLAIRLRSGLVRCLSGLSLWSGQVSGLVWSATRRSANASQRHAVCTLSGLCRLVSGLVCTLSGPMVWSDLVSGLVCVLVGTVSGIGVRHIRGSGGGESLGKAGGLG